MAGTTIVSVVLDNASTVQFTAIIAALVVVVSVVYYTRFCKGSDSVKGSSKKRSKGEGGRKDQKKGGNKPNQTERKNRQQPVFAHPWSLGALKGHTSPVLDLDLSPNGKYMATCAEDPPPPDRNERPDKTDDKAAAIKAGNKKTWNTPKKFQNQAEFPVFVPSVYRTLNLTNGALYSRLKSRAATHTQLSLYGYPTAMGNGRAYIKPPSLKFLKLSQRDRLGRFNVSKREEIQVKTCCRCQKNFLTKPDGQIHEPEACVYHWGRVLYTGKENETVRSCCNGGPGCCVGKSHVSVGVIHGFLDDFVATRPIGRTVHDGDYGIYALDCEMCYTTKGLALAKVTLVRPDGTTAYDELVRPEHEVVDFNTRFSGITQSIMASATKSLSDVRRELLELVYAETILVGHSLENDLRALRLVHSTVVDTAIVFPHIKGFPFRRALKAVVAAVFKRDIQRLTHDSAEDARASLELVLWKVRKEITAEMRQMNRQRRRNNGPV